MLAFVSVSVSPFGCCVCVFVSACSSACCCLSLCLSDCLCVCLSVGLSIYLPVGLSACLYLCLSTCRFVCLSFSRMSASLFFFIIVHIFFNLIHLNILFLSGKDVLHYYPIQLSYALPYAASLCNWPIAFMCNWYAYQPFNIAMHKCYNGISIYDCHKS